MNTFLSFGQQIWNIYREFIRHDIQPLLQKIPYVKTLIEPFPLAFPSILLALTLLLVLLGLFFGRRFFTTTKRGRHDSPANRDPKNILQANVQTALAQKNYASAAYYYEKLTKPKLAIKYYLKAKQFAKAADIYLKLDKVGDAIKCLQKIKDWNGLGQLYEAQKQFKTAAEYFQKANEYGRAGALWLQLEEWQEAATCCEKANDLQNAALANEKAERFLAAAKLYERLIENQSDPEKKSALAKLSGKNYERAKEHGKAMELYGQYGLDDLAAHLESKLGNYDAAAMRFEKIGEYLKAAECFEKLGNFNKASYMKAVSAEQQQDHEQAAIHFEEAREFKIAGDLYRKIGNYQKAGEMYEAAQQPKEAASAYMLTEQHKEKAARLYETAGDLETAAAIYKELGQFEREIDILKKAGKYFEAGEALYNQQQYDAALIILQKVAEDSPQFRSASGYLGDIFFAKGQYGVAIEAFRRVLGDERLQSANLASHYKLARCFEEMQEPNDALKLYEKILVIDYTYQDVKERVEQLKNQVRLEKLEGKTVIPTTPHWENATTNIFSLDQMKHTVAERYGIINEIGRGGMGVVYLAKDNNLKRIIAYKVLPAHFANNPKAIELFLREGRAAALLSHPNIVTIYDAGQGNGHYFIALEFVEGKNLHELIESKKHFSFDQIYALMQQLARALAYAHEKGLIHRDIKPSNILVTRDFLVKLTDFGIAKLLNDRDKGQLTNCGTPRYAAPEQCLGTAVDCRSDIYSLGLTLYEAVTLNYPFEGDDSFFNHVHLDPRSPRDFRPDLPEDIVAIIMKCLQKKPEDRFQSVQEILKLLPLTEKIDRSTRILNDENAPTHVRSSDSGMSESMTKDWVPGV